MLDRELTQEELVVLRKIDQLAEARLKITRKYADTITWTDDGYMIAPPIPGIDGIEVSRLEYELDALHKSLAPGVYTFWLVFGEPPHTRCKGCGVVTGGTTYCRNCMNAIRLVQQVLPLFGEDEDRLE